MNDERLVADVYDSGDSIARVERRRGAGYVLDGSVIVTVFDFLERKQIRYQIRRRRVRLIALCRKPNENINKKNHCEASFYVDILTDRSKLIGF